MQARSEIGLLHQRLENFELHSGKEPNKKRITFRNVYLKDNLPSEKSDDRYGILFRVEPLPDRRVPVSVTRKRGGAALLAAQHTKHDAAALAAEPGFQCLSPPQKEVLRRLYEEASPQWFCDLTTYEDPVPNRSVQQCGAYQFRCGKETLFAGLIEVLYEMRNTLFHGELVPTKEAVICYEPAFRLVRRFLDCVA